MASTDQPAWSVVPKCMHCGAALDVAELMAQKAEEIHGHVNHVQCAACNTTVAIGSAVHWRPQNYTVRRKTESLIRGDVDAAIRE